MTTVYLGGDEHLLLDRYLKAILLSFKNGGISLAQVRADLTHAITAAALGEQSAFLNHLRIVAEDLETEGSRTVMFCEPRARQTTTMSPNILDPRLITP